MDNLLILAGWCALLFVVFAAAQYLYDRGALRRRQKELDKRTAEYLRRYL